MNAVLVVLALLVVLSAAGAVLAVRWWRRRRIAPTRWPVVLVHGVMGFDHLEMLGRKHHYFRGVAERLEAAGEPVYTVRVPALGSVPERAARLAAYIRALPEPRVNIIAHSMGGLDARYAISRLGLDDRVASLITIGTPHRGTPLADLGNSRVAAMVRALVAAVGVRTEAISWLTTARLARFNEEVADAAGVFYGSVVARANGKLHPALGPCAALLRRHGGDNDGLVSADSQVWGTVVCEIDADHWAQIGWSAGYDAPALYELLVAELRQRGL